VAAIHATRLLLLKVTLILHVVGTEEEADQDSLEVEAEEIAEVEVEEMIEGLSITKNISNLQLL
jgi:hypothetical protein